MGCADSVKVVRSAITRLPLLTWIPIVAGCAGEARDAPPWSAFDSAGVEVVVSHRPRSQGPERWTLEPEPLFRIGEGRDEHRQFSRIVGAFVTGRGEVVVGNGDGAEIRFYTMAGEYVRSVGREGEGPGEYRRLASVHPYVGDSILTFDIRLWRIGVLGPDGSHGRYVQLDLSELGGRPALLGADGSGDFLIRIAAGLGGAPLGQIARYTESLVHIVRSGAGHTTVVPFPGPESVEVAAGRLGQVTSRRPFGRNTLVNVSDVEAITHSNDRFQLERRPGGTLRQILRLDRAVAPLTAADIEAAKAEALDRFGGDQGRELVEALHAPDVLPETLPAWEQLLVDAGGYIWAAVTPSAPRGAERMWDVFSPEGYLLCSVAMPAQLSVTEIGRDYVLGYLTDELGVESLVMYRLRRG